MSKEESQQELEALQAARKEGKITDSQRLRLSELVKQEKEGGDKEKAKPAAAAATGGGGAVKK